MTDCASDHIAFSPLNRRKLHGDFNGGCVTSNAGALLLRETDLSCELVKNLASCIHDERKQSFVDHSVEDLLRQRVYGLALGYEDVNDHDELRRDMAFQTAINRETTLAGHSTLSRFENSVTRSDCVRMQEKMVEHFIQKHTAPPKELILDFDPTDAKLYGAQQQKYYHGYYGDYCYLPLHVFCGDNLLVSYLRPCNIDGSKHAGAILKLLVKRFKSVWPKVNIIFRGDGAFARKHILHWCENNNVTYITGMSSNSILKKEAAALCSQAEQQYNETEVKQRLFGEIQYSAQSWSCKRRIIYKSEHHEHGSNLRFIVTNISCENPQDVYDKKYCLRGEMENKIKQQKLDLASGRMSCHYFIANQFRILLSGVAYILINDLRQKALVGTKLARAYCQTIRLKLFKIGAVVIKNTRRIQYYFSEHHPHQALFRAAMLRLKPS